MWPPTYPFFRNIFLNIFDEGRGPSFLYKTRTRNDKAAAVIDIKERLHNPEKESQITRVLPAGVGGLLEAEDEDEDDEEVGFYTQNTKQVEK
jgi:hypothetical protein